MLLSKKFFLYFILLSNLNLLFASGHKIVQENPFSTIYTTNAYGDFLAIGTSVLCQNNGHGGCNNNYADYLYKSNLIYKQEDIAIPLNSASATMHLPSGISRNEILWAGLYWQGHISGTHANNYSSSSLVNNRKFVDIVWPDGTHTSNLSADKVWYHDFWGNVTFFDDGGYRSFYQGYKDVTSLVKTHFNNTSSQIVTVGNIKASNGKDDYQYFYLGTGAEYDNVRLGYWGNWTLLIVYKYPDDNIPAGTPIKNIQIAHGFDTMVPLPLDGYRTFNVELPVSNFLTPKSGAISSKMLFYASGGERKIHRDAFYIQNANNSYTYTPVTNALNEGDNPFNDTVSTFGIANNSSIDYYPGLDLDIFDISQYMTNNQSNTSLKLEATFANNNSDQSFPGLVAFSTDLRSPNLCYDYSYSQYDQYFTENYNATNGPYITGPVVLGEPVKVKLYIRNTENSDISADDVHMNILDINTSQATYKENSTSVVHPGTIYTTDIPDSFFTVANDLSSIKNIFIGQIDGTEHLYFYYKIDPLRTTLNIPIKARLDYSVTLPISPTENITIPYKVTLDQNIPICTEDQDYAPVRGRFNMVDSHFYTADIFSNGTKYYNLPTQITKREGNFKILSLDPDNLDTLFPLPYSTWVAIQIIDASAFHDSTASCEELSSAVTKTVWMAIDANATSIPFNKNSIQQAINNGQTELLSTSDFYAHATQNAAFRISYNADNNGSLVKTTKITTGQHAGNYVIENFNELAQGLQKYNSDLPANEQNKCVKPITIGNHTYSTMPESCGNASNTNGLSPEELTICMQCVYGVNTKFYCSRDNFSIRPDAIKIQLLDQNQTNSILKRFLEENNTTIGTPLKKDLNLTTGYKYDLKLIATTFIDQNTSIGYTQQFNSNTDSNITYVWSPTSLLTCNDTNNSSLNILMINGGIDHNTSSKQVGKYLLAIRDKLWTKYDNNPNYMHHHDYNAVHFFPSSTPDCVPNSSKSEPLSSTTLNGCDISSTHDSNITNYSYHDLNITFKPYKFTIPTMTFNSFRYTANVDDNDSNDMSTKYIGNITPRGFDNSVPSNYVSGCYANDINITFKGNIEKRANSFKLRFIDYNSTNHVIDDFTRDINNSADNNFSDLNISRFHFRRDNNGIMDINISMNYERNISIATNPFKIEYQKVDVNCTKSSDCQINANLVQDWNITGSNDFTDRNVTYYYGRVHAPEYTFNVNPANARVYYEVYCKDCNRADYNLTDKNESVDSIYWYQNPLHVNNTFGEYNATLPFIQAQLGGLTPNATDLNTTTLTVTGTLAHTNRIILYPDPWLIYNRFNSLANTSEFIVKFSTQGTWGGEGSVKEDNTVSTGRFVQKDNNITRVQRRLDW